MKKIFEITELKIIKIMKLIFYFLPITIIAYKIQKKQTPDLNFYFSTDISKIQVNNSITYFVIFCVLFFSTIIFQKIILPILLMKLKPYKNSEYLQENLNDKIVKISGSNIYKTFTQENPAIQFYHLLTYVSTTLILWFLCLDSLIVIIPILFIMVITYFFSKLINSLLVIKKP